MSVVRAGKMSTIETILSGLGILANFDVICGRDCVEKNKPSPRQIFYIISKLGVKKEETIFIGNSGFDGLAALAAEVAYFRIKDPEKDAERASKILGLH